MSDNVAFVDYEEPITKKVEDWLRQRKITFASEDSIPSMLKPLPKEFLGILYKNPNDDVEVTTKKRRGRRQKKEKLPRFIGAIIRFEDYREKWNWQIDIYGRQHVARVMQLAEDLASSFYVEIIVFLKSEQPIFEKLPEQFFPF